MPLDRDQARAVLLEALPADPKWGVWVDGILDRLEPCVTPRLAEIDVRLVGEAEAKLARIRALAETAEQEAKEWLGVHPEDEVVAHPYVLTCDIRDILDARP